MKATPIKKMLCATALALTPFLAFAGGTNSEDSASTGYEKSPDKSTQQGDMGKGVGTPDSGAPQHGDDSALTSKVQDALKNDALLKNLDIDVKVDNGVATLTGDAKDVRYQGRAAKVASSVQGITSVKNNLTINGNKK